MNAQSSLKEVSSAPPKEEIFASVAKMQSLALRIAGMTCDHCPPAIEKALAAVPGVSAAHVNAATKIVQIEFDPGRVKIGDLIKVIRSIGYAPGTATTRLLIKNMHCSSCVIRVELALQLTPGIVWARANLGPNAVDIEYQPEQTNFQEIRKAIESAGYRVAEPKTEPSSETLDPAEAAIDEEYRGLMRKFWFAAAISLPVMALSYPDLIPGLREWMPMGSDTRRIVWALLGVLSLPVMVWAGSRFFTGMWDALKHRAANMHTLIAIGISAACSATAMRSAAWKSSSRDRSLRSWRACSINSSNGAYA